MCYNEVGSIYPPYMSQHLFVQNDYNGNPNGFEILGHGQILSTGQFWIQKVGLLAWHSHALWWAIQLNRTGSSIWDGSKTTSGCYTPFWQSRSFFKEMSIYLVASKLSLEVVPFCKTQANSGEHSATMFLSVFVFFLAFSLGLGI